MRRDLWIPAGLSGLIMLVVGVLVFMSLQQPELSSFPLSIPEPRDVGTALQDPTTYTLDTRSESRWRYFDFSVGTEITEPRPAEWDLAFRRFHVIANGGPAFFGSGGILALQGAVFDSVSIVPETGYVATEAGRDSTNAAIERWYTYSWSTHVLTPRGQVYAVRTADGRYAKLEIVSYYCPGAVPGCMTIRYAYQGDGSRRVRAADVSADPGPS